MKPCSIIRRRMLAITCERSTMLLLHLLAAQVEEAVLEPGLLGIVALAVDLQRQRLGGRVEHEHRPTTSSTSPVGSDGFTVSARAGDHLAGDRDHALDPHCLGRGERCGAGLEHQLDDAGMVAQVDEE